MDTGGRMGMAGTKFKLKLLAIEEEMAYAELQMHVLELDLFGARKTQDERDSQCQILEDNVLKPAIEALKNEFVADFPDTPLDENDYKLEKGSQEDAKRSFQPLNTVQSLTGPSVHAHWLFSYHKAIINVIAAFFSKELKVCVGQNTTLKKKNIDDKSVWISMWNAAPSGESTIKFTECINLFKRQFISISANLEVTEEKASITVVQKVDNSNALEQTKAQQLDEHQAALEREEKARKTAEDIRDAKQRLDDEHVVSSGQPGRPTASLLPTSAHHF